MKYYLRGLAGLTAVAIGLAIIVRFVNWLPLTKPGQLDEYKLVVKAIQSHNADAATASKLGLQLFPRVEVAETEFDFGKMSPHAVATHRFVIRNTGKAPLLLSAGETSCKCTLSKLTESKIEPGSETVVELEWKSGSTRKFFRHYAVVKTNDPLKPEIVLAIEGEITVEIALEEEELTFGRMAPDSIGKVETYIYSQTDDSLVIDRVEPTSNLIKVDLFPLEMSQKSRLNAKSGFKVQVTTANISSQMAINEKIRFYARRKIDEKTDATGENVAAEGINHDPQQELLELSISGTVGRRVAYYGPVLDSTSMNLGLIKIGETKKSMILVKVRGEQVPDSIRIVDVYPQILNVRIDKDSSKGGTIFRVIVEVDKPKEKCLFTAAQPGRLVLETVGLSSEERAEFDVLMEVNDR